MMVMKAWEVVKPLTQTGAPAERQKSGSIRDDKAKLLSMDNMETGCSSRTGAARALIDGLARVLTEQMGRKSPKQMPKCMSELQDKSESFRTPAPCKCLKSCLNFCLSSIRCGNSSTSKSQKDSGFFSQRAPDISLKDYLSLCLRSFRCSEECCVLALVYINRITKADPDITVSR